MREEGEVLEETCSSILRGVIRGEDLVEICSS